MFNQKGFSKVVIIIIVLILIGGAYFTYDNNKKDKDVFSSDQTSTSQIPIQSKEKQILTAEEMPEELTEEEENLKLQGWKTYRNEEYGFELTYPSVWTLRDGNKDYKSTGLNNFYQFCNKVITTPDEPFGPNDNFVGRCEGEYFRVNIWKPTAEMKMIANDFTPSRLDKENKITINGKSASEFVYSGHSEILEGMHTWHLFVVKVNNYIYSITGDSCIDNGADCNQILSTFKFTK